jgi:hypothetical protein
MFETIRHNIIEHTRYKPVRRIAGNIKLQKDAVERSKSSYTAVKKLCFISNKLVIYIYIYYNYNTSKMFETVLLYLYQYFSTLTLNYILYQPLFP